jgi:uncharacterized protein with NAD-binding domain and iron-sulfur cluster/nitrite reductase/ring-hydroxylating ferredoxin subunit
MGAREAEVDVVIVGGGLAGLSAGVSLAARGVRVTVLERGSAVGGKLAAWRDADGDTVEHGVHGWWTQYFNFFDLMRQVGVRPEDVLVGPVDTAYVHEDGAVANLRLPERELPSPLYLAAQIAEVRLGGWDKASAARSLLPSFGFEHARDYRRFDDLSLRSYLARRGATRALLDVALEPLARSLGFVEAGELSTAAFFSALSFYLLGHQDDIRMRVCRGNPRERILEPMVAFIEARGGRVRCGVTVERVLVGADGVARGVRLGGGGAPSELGRFPLSELPADGTPIAKTLGTTKVLVRRTPGSGGVGASVAACSGVCSHAGGPVSYRAASNDYFCPWHGGTFDLDGRVTAGPPTAPLPPFAARVVGTEVVLETSAGSAELAADAVVLATDVQGVRTIVSASPEVVRHPAMEALLNLETTPALAIRLWLDRAPPPELVTGVFTRPGLLDNVFVVSRFSDELAGVAGSVLECHVYSARDALHLTDDALRTRALAELEGRFASLRGAVVRKCHVSRHPDSFTLFSPGSEQHRPGTRSPVPHLLFAGDWIRTETPWWYMERAVATGRLAADALLRDAGQPGVEVRGPRPAPLFVRAAKAGSGAVVGARRAIAGLLGYDRAWP